MEPLASNMRGTNMGSFPDMTSPRSHHDATPLLLVTMRGVLRRVSRDETCCTRISLWVQNDDTLFGSERQLFLVGCHEPFVRCQDSQSREQMARQWPPSSRSGKSHSDGLESRGLCHIDPRQEGRRVLGLSCGRVGTIYAFYTELCTSYFV